MKCKNLFEKIDEMYEQYLGIWEDVCNIESPTDFKEGVDKVGAYFIEKAKELGFEIEVLKQEVAGDAICITMNPDSPNKPVALSGHMDTVHPVGSFGYPPVTKDEEKIYGPGVMDCKGGAVACLYAMDALSKCGFKDRPVMLILQSDEEKGSMPSNLETIKFMCEKAKDAVAFLNCEGHVKDTVVLQRKGILRYEISVHGVALHSANAATASNAVLEAAYKIVELEKNKNPEGLTFNCGVIHGGTTPNTVAGECTFFVDIRFTTDEEEQRARDIVDEVTSHITVEGCSAEAKQVSYRPAMQKADANFGLLEEMNRIYLENGLPALENRFCMSGSDTAYTTIAGIPSVDCIGTAGGKIHSREEFCTLTSLKESAKRLASVAYCI